MARREPSSEPSPCATEATGLPCVDAGCCAYCDGALRAADGGRPPEANIVDSWDTPRPTDRPRDSGGRRGECAVRASVSSSQFVRSITSAARRDVMAAEASSSSSSSSSAGLLECPPHSRQQTRRTRSTAVVVRGLIAITRRCGEDVAVEAESTKKKGKKRKKSKRWR